MGDACFPCQRKAVSGLSSEQWNPEAEFIIHQVLQTVFSLQGYKACKTESA